MLIVEFEVPDLEIDGVLFVVFNLTYVEFTAELVAFEEVFVLMEVEFVEFKGELEAFEEVFVLMDVAFVEFTAVFVMFVELLYVLFDVVEVVVVVLLEF